MSLAPRHPDAEVTVHISFDTLKVPVIEPHVSEVTVAVPTVLRREQLATDCRGKTSVWMNRLLTIWRLSKVKGK